jgi:hypothetical protein
MMNRLRALPPLFYLGLFPVVCVLWAWADSTNNYTSWIRYHTWEQSHSIAASDSALELHYTTRAELTPGAAAAIMRGSRITGPFGRITRNHGRAGMDAPWFPASETITYSGSESGIGYQQERWRLPFWQILLYYVPPWLALAWWQARRKQRKLKGAGRS